jgi:hypothetical protein
VAKKMKNQFTSSQLIAANKLSEVVYGSVSKAIQLTRVEDAKAVGLTKKALGQLAYEIYEKRASRIRNNTKPAALVKQLLDSINSRLTKVLKAGFTYRQPDSIWVEQNNTISVEIRIGKPSEFSVNTYTVWHPKHNWKANESSHKLFLNPADSITTVGGLLTVYAKADSNKKAIPCRWWEQSRGFTVKEVHGYLVNKTYHIEAESAKEAIEKVKRITEKQKKELLKFDSEVFTASKVNKAFGFCMAGIRQFCEANGIDHTSSFTGKELRDIVVRNRDLNCKMYQGYLKKMGVSLNCK